MATATTSTSRPTPPESPVVLYCTPLPTYLPFRFSFNPTTTYGCLSDFLPGVSCSLIIFHSHLPTKPT